MKVYGIRYTDSDGCTYSCDVLYKVYAKREDAETEITRLELIGLMAAEVGDKEYYDWYRTLSDDDKVGADHEFFYIDEIEVL